MRTLVDTSALYALLDEDDERHGAAAQWLTEVGANPATTLITHNYVVVESVALVQRRLGQKAVRVLLDAFLPILSVFFVDEELHLRAASAFRAGGPGVSLVDHTSFELIRLLGLDQAFAFDNDFGRAGFATVP